MSVLLRSGPRCLTQDTPTLALALLLASGVSCSRQQPPERTGGGRLGTSAAVQAEDLFSQAEALRLRYEEQADKEAIEKYLDSLEIWSQAGDFEKAAKAGRRVGRIHEQKGDLSSALDQYQQSLEFAKKSNDPSLESQLLSDVGAAHIMLGEPEQAQQRCEEALELGRQPGSPQAEAAAFICFGELEYFRGHLDLAIGSYSKAHSIHQTLGDVEGQAQSLLFLGYSHSDRSDFEQASAFFSEALDLWRAISDRRGEGLTLVALGRLHLRLGEYQSALNSFNEAMPLIESMGDVVWQASIHAGLGSVYYRMADHERAGEYWTRALDLFREAGLQMAEVEMLESVGQIHLARGDPTTALTYFEQAHFLARELENPRWEAHSLRFIGQAYESMGESSKAVESLKQSLALHRSIEDQRYEAYTFGDLGNVYKSLGESDLALDCFRKALALSQASNDRVGESIGYFNLARHSRAQQPEEAREHVERALSVAESLRSGVESHQLRSSYLAAIQQYYKLQIDVLMHLHPNQPADGLDALAFEASERARARSLLESLTEAGVDVRTGVDPDLLARERQLRRALDSKADRQFNLGSDMDNEGEASTLAKEIRNLTGEYDQLQAEIRSQSPRYAALTQPQPLSLPIAQQDVLDEETLVLEYSLGEERSFLWAVESQEYAAFELPPKNQIEERIREVFQDLTARLPVAGESVRDYRTRVRGSDDDYWASASILSEILLGPVADRLRDKRIVVISDGTMQYLPFSALPVPGPSGGPAPLIVDHEIVNLPSLSALGVLRSETLGRSVAPLAVAVLADPVFELDDPRLRGGIVLAEADASPRSVGPSAHSPLSSTQRALRDVDFLDGARTGIPRLVATRPEADAILALAPAGQALRAVGFDATRDNAMSPDLGQYRIIHFATHGVVNNENPGLSGILLSMVDEKGRSQNGFLRLHDIYNLELPVELVVLSACNTALGKPVDGEGLVGLVRGFMYAGARRVVASLWKVDDVATGELMGLFYKEMLQEGRSPAAALRHAQLAMWQQSEWQSPFYWAAFVLQGEWM